MVKEGLPFVIIPLLIALVFAFFYLWLGVIAFVLLAAFMAFFSDRAIDSTLKNNRLPPQRARDARRANDEGKRSAFFCRR